jgi:diguanylate cyclase (GGDEF)-like protein
MDPWQRPWHAIGRVPRLHQPVMNKPGFRKSRPGGPRPKAEPEGDGFLSSSLFSQAQILQLMKNEFARARRHGLPLGCMMLQIDRLPQLVDLHGASLRSVVRAAMARLVREKTRGSDMIGTTNDDRYLVVLPHTNLTQTRIVAERLHGLFGEFEVAIDGRALALGLSIGITAFDDQKALFFDTLLAQSEAALEFAAGEGGDQVASFGETQLRGSLGEGRGDTGERRRASDRDDNGDGP